VISAIISEISRDLQGIMASAKASHVEATHEQNKPENKYDTRALEASYLARGQSRQVAELENARHEYEALTPVDFLPDTPLDVGALVMLEEHPQIETCYFLGPKAGGTEIAVAGTSVTVITPQSPLGRQLVGRKLGEVVVLQGREHRIALVR
jgi:transcription elongation GreA/GreB family factor